VRPRHVGLWLIYASAYNLPDAAREGIGAFIAAAVLKI
jgi:hypothetical protein